MITDKKKLCRWIRTAEGQGQVKEIAAAYIQATRYRYTTTQFGNSIARRYDYDIVLPDPLCKIIGEYAAKLHGCRGHFIVEND